MASHQELHDLIAAYALGALDDEDARAVESHLDGGCESCERELFAATRDLEALAETVEPIQPAETTRARILRPLSDRGRPQPRAAAAWLPRVAAAAVLILLGWSVWTQLSLRGELERQAAARTDADQRLASVRQELEQTRGSLARLALANRIVSAPRSRAVLLAGLETAPQASGQTFVDPAQGRAVFYASNLPEVAPDETYQLWFIADDTPVSAGIFDVEADGSVMHLVDDVADVENIQLWAVTIEPAGGVPQPTGAMVLKG